MVKISTVEARENFAELINRAAYGKNRIILTRRGKALAAVIPMTDFEQLPEEVQELAVAGNNGSVSVEDRA